MVRSRLPQAEIVPEVRRRLAQIDPSLPFVFHSWPDALAFVLFPARVATATLGVMGLLAAMLTVTGVFGMAMYSVSKRMKEFGIRVALGAPAAQLLRPAVHSFCCFRVQRPVCCWVRLRANCWHRSYTRPRRAIV